MKGGEKEEHLQSEVLHGIHAKPPEGRRGRWSNVVDTISLLSSFYLSLLDTGNEASTKFCGDALAAPELIDLGHHLLMHVVTEPVVDVVQHKRLQRLLVG